MPLYPDQIGKPRSGCGRFDYPIQELVKGACLGPTKDKPPDMSYRVIEKTQELVVTKPSIHLICVGKASADGQPISQYQNVANLGERA